MVGFVPDGAGYKLRGHATALLPFGDLEPLRRAKGVPIFNTNGVKTARERVTHILRAFVSGTPLPPIEVYADPAVSNRFQLYDGLRRIYCSVAAGYSAIPVMVIGKPKPFEPRRSDLTATLPFAIRIAR